MLVAIVLASLFFDPVDSAARNEHRAALFYPPFQTRNPRMDGIWTPDLYAAMTIIFVLTLMARSILAAAWSYLTFHRDLSSRN